MVEILYEKYYRELIRWCQGMTRSETVAEDLVQDAFLRALRHREELDGMQEAQGRAWLYRTAKNLYIDRVRHSRYETVAELSKEESSGSAYENFENEQFISILPEQEKQLFQMRYLEGYNSTELGEMFGISPATVRMRLASARRRLKKEWEE